MVWYNDRPTGGWRLFTSTQGTSLESDETWSRWIIRPNNTCADIVWPRWLSDSATTATDYLVDWPTRPHIDQAAFSRESFERTAHAISPQPRNPEARNRARQILVEHLSQAQKDTLEKHGYFDVEAGGRWFRIYGNSFQHNIFELDANGRKIREYCAHTSLACPREDHMLAQKFMIEASFEEFARVANIWDLRGHRRIIHESGREVPPDIISPYGQPMVSA